MKLTKKINEREFQEEKLNNEELKTILGGFDHEEITEESYKENKEKVIDQPKISN